MKRKAIIVDLDGTLADCEHRRPLLQFGKWKDFFELAPKDTPTLWCMELMEAMRSRGYAILLVTGRPTEYRAATEEWLKQHRITYDWLFMRPGGGDSRKDSVVKGEIYNGKIRDQFEVLFTVDDRRQVVEMWRQLGLTCLQCAEGNF
jgi:hypothetical protein